jgi:hypothetical protein
MSSLARSAEDPEVFRLLRAQKNRNLCILAPAAQA